MSSPPPPIKIGCNQHPMNMPKRLPVTGTLWQRTRCSVSRDDTPEEISSAGPHQAGTGEMGRAGHKKDGGKEGGSPQSHLTAPDISGRTQSRSIMLQMIVHCTAPATQIAMQTQALLPDTNICPGQPVRSISFSTELVK